MRYHFVLKFGLKYTYNMAWDGNIGSTVVEKKLCPEGWQIPNLRAWVDVVKETGSPNDADALQNGAEYLGTTSLIEPIDSRTVFAPENLEANGTVHVKATHPSGMNSSWVLSVPETMSKGQVENAGLNILPSGRISFPAKNTDATKDWSFGSGAFFLEKSNGVMVVWPYKDAANGSNGNQMGSAGRYNVGSSVRCIKVVG